MGDVSDVATQRQAVPADYFDQARQEIEPFLPLNTTNVLEIGCAHGGTMKWLRSIRRVEQAVGLDVSEQAAIHAREVFDRVVVADLGSALPDLGNSRFDLVLALDVLEHLPDPWRVVQSIRGHMAPGATLIVSLPNIAHFSTAWSLLVRGTWNYADSGLLDRTHLRFFTKETAQELLQSAGLVIEKMDANQRAPDVLQQLGLTGRRWRWYNERLMRALLPSRLVDWQHLIAARNPG